MRGFGTRTWDDGDHYEGDFRDGVRHGCGTLDYGNGTRYQGEWRNDKPNGRGTYAYKDGTRYEGVWRDGCLETQSGEEVWTFTTKEACGFE